MGTLLTIVTNLLALAKKGKRVPKKYFGFSLIQVSIILTIAALTMVAVLPSYQASLKGNSTGVNKMNVVMDALRQYETIYGALPCPADPTMGTANSGYGVAVSSAGTCAGGTLSYTGTTATGNAAIGMVPVQTLGLPSEYALDGFGRDITYAVDTSATACWANGSLPGSIAISDNVVTQNSVAVLVSHGANGHGAWLPLAGSGTGATRFNNGSTDASQLANAQINSSFVNNSAFVSFVSQPATPTFDDIIVYKGRTYSLNILPNVVTTGSIVNVTSYPANNVYSSGKTLTFSLQFPQTVTVSGGVPRLALTAIAATGARIGTNGTVGYATYTGTTNGNTLNFSYPVSSSDYTPSGIQLASPIMANGASIIPCFSFFTPPNLSGVILNNNVYVTDVDHYRVLKFDGSDNYLATFGTGSSSSKDGAFATPLSVAIDYANNVWVSDSGAVDRVEALTSANSWALTIGGKTSETCSGTYATATTCNYLTNASGTFTGCCKPNSSSCTCSSGNATTASGSSGQFNFPNQGGQMAFDATNNLWVADGNNSRVLEFYTAGTYPYTYRGGFAVASKPSGLAIDQVTGNIWVMSPGNSVCALQKCSVAGSCSTYSSCGTSGGQFSNTASDADYIAIDNSTNSVWVSDMTNCRIQKFNLTTGAYANVSYSFATACPAQGGPSGIATDGNGILWVLGASGISGGGTLYKINESDGSNYTGVSPITSANSIGLGTPGGLYFSR